MEIPYPHRPDALVIPVVLDRTDGSEYTATTRSELDAYARELLTSLALHEVGVESEDV